MGYSLKGLKVLDVTKHKIYGTWSSVCGGDLEAMQVHSRDPGSQNIRRLKGLRKKFPLL